MRMLLYCCIAVEQDELENTVLIILVIFSCFLSFYDCNYRQLADDLIKNIDYENDDDEIEISDDEIRKADWWGSSKRCHTNNRYKPCANVRYNGCGTESISSLKLPFESTFEPACNKHDVCYNCALYYGWSQKECDDRFKTDMDYLCGCRKKSFSCVIIAKAYHIFVKAFGHKYIAKNIIDWCECARERGDVNERV